MLDIEDIELIKNIVSEAIAAKNPPKTPIKKTKKKVVKKSQKTPQKQNKQKKQSNTVSIQPIRLSNKKPVNTQGASRIAEIEGKCHNYGRTESFQLVKNRPNLFLSSDIKNMHKEDVKIDKILNKNKNKTQRRDPVQMYSVDCIRCGKEFVVTYDIIPFDAETNEPNYTCDSCARR